MKILYVGYFSEFNGQRLFCSPAANNVCTYFQEVLSRNNKDEVIILNIARPKKHLSFFKSSITRKENMTLVNAPSYGSGRILSFFTKWMLDRWIRKFITKNISYNDCIIFYHSLNTLKLESFVSKNYNSILQVEEIYSDLFKKYSKYKAAEKNCFGGFNKIILPSATFAYKKTKTQDVLYLYGSYQQCLVCKPSRKKNTLVYSGTVDEALGVLFLPEIMQYLPDYTLYIYGHGSKNDYRRIVDRCSKLPNIIINSSINQKELEERLSEMSIGINPRPNTSAFSFSAFPSKIMVYLKCGLNIISSPLDSIKDSPFGQYITFSEYDPKKFADSIRNMSQKTNLKALNFIKGKDKEFEKDLFALVHKQNSVANTCDGESRFDKHKNIFFKTFYVFLMIFFSVSTTCFSSSVNSSIDSIFNHCLKNETLFKENDNNLIFSVKDNNEYYLKNREKLIIDKKPLIYANGTVKVNGVPTESFESFPLHYSTEDKPHYSYLAQRILLEQGNETFVNGYSVIISKEFYKSIFGSYPDNPINGKTVEISFEGRTIEAKVNNVFNTERSSYYSYNGLFTQIYGEHYCFVNSNISDELGFKDYSILLDRSNYFKYFPHDLFKKTNYKSMIIPSYYDAFSNAFYTEVEKNHKSRPTRIILSLISLILTFSSLVVLIFKKACIKSMYQKRLIFWILFSSVFSIVNVFLALLVKYVLPSWYLILAGFGISFVLYFAAGVALTIVGHLGVNKCLKD